MELLDSFELNGGILLGGLFIFLVGFAGGWRLFAKCGQPGWAAIVPGYNLVIIMKIIGRPASHALSFLILPLLPFYFFRTILELVSAFGKKSTADYVMACVFNFFYILNLGLSEEEEYAGPVYGVTKTPKSQSDANMAVA